MLDAKADNTGPEKIERKVWQTCGIMSLKCLGKGIVMPNKFLLVVVAVLMLVFMVGCGGETKPKEANSEPTKEIVNVEQEEELTEAEKIEKVIRDRIAEKEYRKVEIDRIAINENMADDGTYIALVYLDFNVMNTIKTGNDMMRMYSDDIVARLGEIGIENVGEAAVFWKDGYNDRSLKYAYEYRNGNFYLTSKME